MKKTALLLIFVIMSSSMIFSQVPKEIILKAPQLKSGKLLMESLSLRSSHREFKSTPLSIDHLSGLLWAAWGINRPESGKRTAPSAVNWQDIILYACLPGGIYRYDEVAHKLVLIKEGDYRKATGLQAFAANALLNLIFVSDYDRMERGSEQDKLLYSGLSTGYISQNVYLYCASEGLNTVVRASVDRDELSKIMGLTEKQHIVAAQSVGYAPDKID